MQRVPRKAALTLALVAALLLTLTCDAACDAAAARFCTTTLFPPSARLADSSATYLTATARPDTVRAGAGPGSFAQKDWQRDISEASRPIFGQVVRLREVGGAGAEAARQARERGVERAVLVPWGRSADCSPLPWSRRWQWMPSGMENFIGRAHLRPREDWVRGLPTFDTQSTAVYPHSRAVRSYLMSQVGITERLRDSIRATLPPDRQGALRTARATADSLHYQILLPAQKARLAAIMDTMDTTRTYSMTTGIAYADDSSVADTSWSERVSARTKARWMASDYVRDSSHAQIADRHEALRERIRRKERALRRRVYEAVQRTPLPSDSLLSAEEYFSLHAALPHYTGESVGATSSLAPLRRWEAMHPGLATRYPASRILREAYERKKQR